MPFKSGFIAVAGRPNVGKSTLINALAGEKVAITSPKPQTTRNAIKAIVNREGCQVVFIDTPGIHRPRNKLGEYMMNAVSRTLQEVDAVLFITEACAAGAASAADTIGACGPAAGDVLMAESLRDIDTPVFLIINKIDLVRKEQLLPLMQEFSHLADFKSIIPVSALKKDGLDALMAEIVGTLPDGPRFFPDDMVTDQPERFLAAELIREKALEAIRDEVPHGIGIGITAFIVDEKRDFIEIQADIYCEKDSHKGILIGKNGAMLKNIGTLARKEMEGLLGSKVFLQLWVKVKPGWRNSNMILKTLGYGGNG